jgi:hypothetical protein
MDGGELLRLNWERTQIDAAAANLLHLAEEIGQEHPEKAPSLLCVVCGLSNAAYLRPDGVAVVPITALKD